MPGHKAVVGADIRTAHECSLWSNTSMGTARLDPQRQYVTVTKCNARAAGARPSVRGGFRGSGRRDGITHRPWEASIRSWWANGFLAGWPKVVKSRASRVGPCGEASRCGRSISEFRGEVRVATLAAVLPISDIMSSQRSDESPTFQVTPFMACTTAPTRSPASPTSNPALRGNRID